MASQSPLLIIPREIRDLIYQNVFTGTVGTSTPFYSDMAHAQPQFLRTCRQINDEALGLLYSIDNFVLRIRPEGFSVTVFNDAGQSQWKTNEFANISKFAAKLKVEIVHPTNALSRQHLSTNPSTRLRKQFEVIIKELKKNTKLNKLELDLSYPMPSGLLHRASAQELLNAQAMFEYIQERLLRPFAVLRGIKSVQVTGDIVLDDTKANAIEQTIMGPRAM